MSRLPGALHSPPRTSDRVTSEPDPCGCGRHESRNLGMESIASKDPRAHTANVRREFRELIEHLREDVKKVEDPKAQALFETAAEVITGLETAFKDYEKKSEDAWK